MKRPYSLRRRERLERYSDFEAARREGRTVKGRRLVINVIPNGLEYNRIGVSISKKALPRSCGRHRLKRLVTEAYRLHKPELKKGHNIVVRGRTMRNASDFKEIERELLTGLKRAGLAK